MLMQEKSGNKNKSQSGELTKQLTNALQSIQEPEIKKEVDAIKIENVAERTTTDNKKYYLVQVTANEKDLHKAHGSIVKSFEKKLSSSVVIIPHRRRINGKLHRAYKGRLVPRHETLSHVYDSYLQDIVFPASVVGKRIRYPKSNARQYKVIVDKLDRDTIEGKLGAITSAYKALTNRNLTVEFA